MINAHDCYDSFFSENLARARNQLFTAITRSKAWVRVLGIGPSMERLAKEYNEVVSRDYRLEFKYPDAETRKKLRIIMTRKRSLKAQRGIKELWRLIGSIEAGDVDVDTLPAGVRRKLSSLFRDKQ